ncbi:hypothetical protein Tco_0861500 [Tanacetum coccineum]|uniref:Uncharacterized protein n=1 Tax=Tanacetum coccineum TaxID=301880 RepID=A0ABQ5BKZ7_9ASTR
MTHDLSKGVFGFANGDDEVAYKMPHQIKQYNLLSNLEKEHTKSVYLRNEEDKRRGVDYVMSKILGFYKECLELGHEYVTGLDDEGEVTLYLMRRSLEVLRKFHWMILEGQFNQLSHSIFSLYYLFRNPFSSTTIGDENLIRTLGDYSKPSHEGYRNTFKLLVGNNVVPLLSDTIRLVQNGCSFHGLRSEDPNQNLKDFLKLMDSLDLDGDNMERTRMRLFQNSLCDQASNWLERLPVGSITTWEDLTT